MKKHTSSGVPWWVHYALVAVVVILATALAVVLFGRPESITTLFAVVALIEAIAMLVNALSRFVLRPPS